jgi:hypothetical protein
VFSPFVGGVVLGLFKMVKVLIAVKPQFWMLRHDLPGAFISTPPSNPLWSPQRVG